MNTLIANKQYENAAIMGLNFAAHSAIQIPAVNKQIAELCRDHLSINQSIQIIEGITGSNENFFKSYLFEEIALNFIHKQEFIQAIIITNKIPSPDIRSDKNSEILNSFTKTLTLLKNQKKLVEVSNLCEQVAHESSKIQDPALKSQILLEVVKGLIFLNDFQRSTELANAIPLPKTKAHAAKLLSQTKGSKKIFAG